MYKIIFYIIVSFNLGYSQNPFYLHENGVTIKCHDWGKIGDKGELNGIVYTVVDEEQLFEMIHSGDEFYPVCTTKIRDMSELFYGHIRTPDISSWDTSNVTNMSKMFEEFSFYDMDISNWDVSSVTNMNRMFYNTTVELDLSGWNLVNVTNMSQMFSNSIINSDISNWDVSNVTDMSEMFKRSILNQNLSNWDVSNVTKCKDFSLYTEELGWVLPKPNFINCSIN